MNGPKNVSLADMQVVVGDFNGNGYVKLASIRDRSHVLFYYEEWTMYS